MFHVFIKSHFSAGHHLRDYPGNCERPHGHNWKVEVTVKTSELDSLGMGIDFRQVKEAVKKDKEAQAREEKQKTTRLKAEKKATKKAEAQADKRFKDVQDFWKKRSEDLKGV